MLAAELIRAATAAHLTLAAAESCTGGLVCGALTDVSGSSAVVRGGVVSYAVSVKEHVLGVSPDIIEDPDRGVVSSACAEAMAEGVRSLLAADVAVSTTGIAGPTGAEPGKPVGTVWFGVSSVRGTRSAHRLFEGDRARVRSDAVLFALELLLEEVLAVSGA